jgi:hypothetical protein
VLFVLLTATLFLSKILRIFVVTPIKKLCCGHEEEQVEDVPDFSELIMPGDPRFDKPLEEGAKMTSKLSGLKSYRLEDNPDYQALFPESVLTGETIQLEFEEPPEETPPEDQDDEGAETEEEEGGPAREEGSLLGSFRVDEGVIETATRRHDYGNKKSTVYYSRPARQKLTRS